MVVMGWRLFFCVPGYLALLAIGVPEAGGWISAMVGAGAAALILLDRAGRWPAFITMWLAWIFGAVGVVATIPTWPVLIGAALALCVASFAALRIGSAWGHARAARLTATGRGIREAEWVFTGAPYVRGHPLNRLSFGLWASVVVLALCFALSVTGIVLAPVIGAQAVLAVAFLLPIWPIIARKPVAYPLVIGAFITSVIATNPVLMALMLPVLMYWVDGVRPNLIYRYRFERLSPQGERHVS